MTPCYVTTSIPYVNARPHIGFALELVLADAVARWNRQKGRDTFFLTGTDENALKNIRVAQELGLTPRQLCDRNAAIFKDLTRALNISADDFIRTSEPRHHRGASALWSACRKTDLILKNYRGLYCTGCEDFYQEKDLIHGRCPDHLTEPDPVEEQNYFFRLSAYQEHLEKRLATSQIRILPETRRNEALAFIRQGLQDFSVSRISERSGGWGVPVPGDPTQTLYVWFDALANYLTALGYGSDETRLQRYWRGDADRIHVIGKNVLKFHAVYWPALLLSAGLPLPNTLLAHGFLTVNGQKISKSFGNAIDPFPLIDRYGTDALRCYLLRAIPAGADADFTEARFHDFYTSELANGLGNLVRRLETLCERARFAPSNPGRPALPEDIAEPANAFQFHTALNRIWDRIRDLNRSLETEKPWELLKHPAPARLRGHLAGWIGHIRSIASGLTPFLPETARKIEHTFAGPRIVRGEPLFPRRD